MKAKNIDMAEKLIKRLRQLESFVDSQGNYDSKIFINGYSCHNNNQGRPIDVNYLLSNKDLKDSILNNVKNEIDEIKEEILNLE